MILQSLYNLSDAQIEFQIRDRMTFMTTSTGQGLGLDWESTVTDELSSWSRAVWLFRAQLTKAELIKPLSF